MNKINSHVILVMVFFAIMLGALLKGWAKDKAEASHASVLDFKMKNIDGQMVNLAQYKGNVILLVNVASKCGNTPQYEGLQALYEKYKDEGFVVLGFPANNFKNQEPGTDPQFAGEIKWNFEKFLIDRQGKVAARFDPKVQPESDDVRSAIEKLVKN
jgi:glutathione peroxidase